MSRQNFFKDDSRKGKIIVNNLSGNTRSERVYKADKLSGIYISASHGKECFTSFVKDLS